MATITRSLSAKIGGNGCSEIMLRVNVSRSKQIRIKSGIFAPRDRVKSDGSFMYPRVNQVEKKHLQEIEHRLIDIERRIIDLCEQDPDSITKGRLESCVDPNRTKRTSRQAPSKHAQQVVDDNTETPDCEIYYLFEDCIRSKGIAPGTAKTYRVLARALCRFEMYKRMSGDKSFTLTPKSLTEPLKDEIKAFLKDETPVYAIYPEIYDVIRAGSGRKGVKPEPRGRNTLVTMFKKFGSFIKWCNARGLSNVNPDMGLKEIGAEIYGDPILITKSERDMIWNFDLSAYPHLEIHRDIFIFQCYVGCRVSDLIKLTPANVDGDYLNYIPQKTVSENAGTVRVPLRPIAKCIIKRYAGKDRAGRLLPFTTTHAYNRTIKTIFKMVGITRNITRLNPKTKQPEQVPICDVASSHMARRTFIGNLYHDIKDPNIIGAMSGHVVGSKAFARYRNITDDVLIDAVKNL